MNIHRVWLQNFMSWKRVDVDLSGHGLVLIEGLNGSGKSSLFVDAPAWALFGHTVREKLFGSTSREFPVDGVINARTDRGCAVGLVFELDGRVYEVIRSRKHFEYGTAVRLSCDGRDISGEGIKETEVKIAELIKASYATFTNSIIFGQGAVKRFSQSTDAERRRILEDFLPELDLFTQAHLHVKNDCAKAKEVQDKVAWETDRVSRELDGAVSDLTTAQGRLDGFVEEHASSLEESGRTLVESKARSTSIEKEIRKCKVTIGQKEEVRDLLFKGMLSQEEYSRLTEELNQHQAGVTELLTHARMSDELVGKIRGRLDKFTSGDECPECFREFDGTSVEAYKVALAEGEEAESGTLKELDRQIKSGQNKVKGLLTRVEDNEKNKDKHFSAVKELRPLDVRMGELKDELSGLERRILEAESDEQMYEERRQTIKETVVEAKLRGEGLSKKLASVEEKVERVGRRKAHLEYWLTGFSNKGVKEFCFRECLDYVNARIERFAQVLTDGQISIWLSADASERIGVNVTIEDGAGSYLLASAGQERRVDLCIALAFQSLVETTFRTNLSVFDEFDGSLDELGVARFVEFLEEEAQKKGTVFVTTHNPDLKVMIPTCWTVLLDSNGYSSITKD